VNYNYR